MVTVRKSAKIYMERRTPANQETRRLPSPRVCFSRHPVHALTVQVPYPLVDIQRDAVTQPPEGGATSIWPYGHEER